MPRQPLLKDVSPHGLVFLGSISLLLLITGIWLASSWLFAKSPLPLVLVGTGVEKLESGTPAVLANETIGEVRETRMVEGKKHAVVVIESEFADQMVAGCSFRVVSGNMLMPGNLVVQVAPPTDYAGRVPLTPGMVVNVESSVLPAEIPTSLYLLIGGVLLLLNLLVLGFAIAKQLSRFFIFALIVAIVAVAIWLFSSEQVGIGEL